MSAKKKKGNSKVLTGRALGLADFIRDNPEAIIKATADELRGKRIKDARIVLTARAAELPNPKAFVAAVMFDLYGHKWLYNEF